MKILIDANLSYRLIKKLAAVYPETKHVEQTDLPVSASDEAIWHWAKQNEYIFIVSNDDDFRRLSQRFGFPPKVVLLKTGNQSTNFIAQLLIKHKGELDLLEASTVVGLLEIG